MTTANPTASVPRLPALDGRHWPTGLLLAVTVILYLLAGLSVGVGDVGGPAVAGLPSSLPRELRRVPPPTPEPLAFRKIAPRDAVALNAAVPVSTSANPAARAYAFAKAGEYDRLRAVECLTAAVYYEAAIESDDGQRAVAQVVLNRVRHPAYPGSVCGVVFQGSERSTGCQFTFTCDGSLARTPSTAGWARARKVAEEALGGHVFKPVGWSTHYHTNWVVPYWSSSLTKAANVGTHIFYRWADGWGRPPAFSTRAIGVEPEVAKMARLTSVPLSITVGEVAPDPLLPGKVEGDGAVGSVDSFQRAVLRRYEPATRQGVAGVIAAQTKEGETVSPTYRWALTGEAPGPAQTPFGRKAEPKPVRPCPEAKPAEAGKPPVKPVVC